ncbi:MAG: putative FecR-like transrane sensor for ferric citrate transport [Rhodospirillales bacterium]|jgi:transmembrane sensor|nr:putative FecR-like transrane sensor for ferric citrate transport [Rhodospirillales bacterium]
MPETNPDRSAKDQAIDWFTRLRDNGGETASPAVHAAFDIWLNADPAHEEAYRAVERMWDSDIFTDSLRRAAHRVEAPSLHVKRSRWRPARRARNRKSWAIAASILIALGATFLATDAGTRLQADHIAEVGEQRRVTLADGSRVLLNTDSAIAVDMTEADRSVRLLKGEAFFDVVPDATRPFHVHGGGADIRVVGTAFAVRLNEDATIVTVREGRVQVTDSEQTTVTVDPGLMTRVRASGLIEPYPADMVASLAWTTERLIFEDRTLGEIVDELGRYHTGLILFASDRLRSVRVGGNYRLDDPVAALAAMAKIASAELVRISDYVLILR